MMDDKELDRKLEIARNQSEKFFSKFSFEESRKIVHKRIENRKQGRASLAEKCLGGKPWLKGAVVACTMALFWLISNQANEIVRHPSGVGTPIMQQTVELDGYPNSHLVNYFRVDNPNRDNNLLAVLWHKELDGSYEIIYSSIMENADLPKPVTVMGMPYSQSKFALVSSINKSKGFMHYRLIKYSNNTAKAFLEENYVPEGKIEIRNGMLVEERTVPGNYYSEGGDEPVMKYIKAYRYFIPLELTNDGSLSLTTNEIILKKGSVLTLLPDDRLIPIEFEYNNRILDHKTPDTPMDFEAKETGTVDLKIKEKNNLNKANELHIKVVE